MAVQVGRKQAKWGVVASLVAMTGGAVADPRAQVGTLTGSWNQFSADISIRQALVDGAGQLLRTPPPAVALRMLRTRAATGWRTTLTLVRQDAPAINDSDPIPNPFLIGRVEYDGDGTPPRFYDQLGRLVSGPTAANRSPLAMPPGAAGSSIDWEAFRRSLNTTVVAAQSSAWVDEILATPAKRGERRLAIEGRYGRATSRVNGLDRYVTTAGTMLSELLVRPDMAVPVELNQTDNGVLVGRLLFTYDVRGDGTLIRRVVHAERTLGDSLGSRSVIDLEMTNVVARAGVVAQ